MAPPTICHLSSLVMTWSVQCQSLVACSAVHIATPMLVSDLAVVPRVNFSERPPLMTRGTARDQDFEGPASKEGSSTLATLLSEYRTNFIARFCTFLIDFPTLCLRRESIIAFDMGPC
jgi:hypothetical protein